MSDDDKEYLRALYAGLAMVGWIMNGDYTPEEIPPLALKQADAMLELLEPDEGIVSIRKRKYVKRQETK